MIVDVYHLLVTKSGGHLETYELRVQSETNPTLVSVISDAWMSRNQRQPQPNFNGKPFSYQYSELASYENRQNIARQGFCLRIIENPKTALHLNNATNSSTLQKLAV